MTASSQLLKSRMFVVLISLTALLAAASLVMYTQLDSISHEDDYMLGVSGGDGQGFDLRAKKKGGGHHLGRVHRPMDGGKRNRMEEEIANFVAFKANEAKRRAKAGRLTTREEFERDHPYGSDKELLKNVQKLRRPDIPTFAEGMPYDIYNCPETPSSNYPHTWNVRKVLENWNPDVTDDMPTQIYQGLCVFDWQKDQKKMLAYRDAEVPFVVQNVPEVMKASLRWMSDNYMDALLGDEPIRNEHSRNNQFMYWKTRHPIPNWEPPTDMVELTYHEWHRHAVELDALTDQQQLSQEHWYFRLNSMLGMDHHPFVYEELPFFDPSLGESMTMIHPKEHRGVNCRFGMKGVTAETHYDSSTNFIALMGGQRRYILAHPDQCIEMELYPEGHPSGRHSQIEWAKFDFAKSAPRPFLKAQVNEVVLQAGDMLYLPTYWFHFIVSLNRNYQCNSRSGFSHEYEQLIDDCGFTPATRGKQTRQQI